MMERLDGPEAEAFLAGALALARGVVPTRTHFEVAVRALEATLAERPFVVAPTLVFDVTVLLAGEALTPLAPVASPELREVLRQYEDHVLARLVSERRWTRLSEAVAAAPKGQRPEAVGLAVSMVLERLGLTAGVGLSQGLVRRLASRPPGEVLVSGQAALHVPAVAARLAEGLRAVSRAARRARELLSDAEIFVVENLAALKGLGSRVALTQLAEVAQAVEEALPSRARARGFDDGVAPTGLEEESALPMGGFSSLGTVGSPENLVTSELIYMEPSGASRPDLFDVRFVEGELLYYARDESVALRRRRVLALVFDASLAAARVLDGGERYQRLVWALGAVVALVRRLSAWLGAEALRFELYFPAAAFGASLRDERGLMELLLRDLRERGRLDVFESEDAAAALRQARAAHGPAARSVLLTAQFPGGLEAATAPAAVVEVGSEGPRIHWFDGGGSSGGPSGAGPAWSHAAQRLLDGLLSRPDPAAR